MAKRKKKIEGMDEYIQDLNEIIKEESGIDTIPAKLKFLIRKTAQDMSLLDRLAQEINKDESLINYSVLNVSGGQKLPVNPLLPYYEKMSARVTDDLYNLGLTSRKAALKSDDSNPNDDNPMQQLAEAMKK